MPQIWSDEYLWQLHNDADDEICREFDVVYQRFPLEVRAGNAVYTLPEWVRKIDAIYWKGKKVDPISFETMTLFHSGSRSSTSYFYTLWPGGIKQIAFYPSPAETLYPYNPIIAQDMNHWGDEVLLTLDGITATKVTTAPPFSLNWDLSPYDGSGADSYVVIACYRTPTDSMGNADYQLPEWMARRTKKAFVLSKAYAKEGKGQNLVAAQYFAGKFDFLISRFKQIFSGCFVSKKYRLMGGLADVTDRVGRRPAKPALPANYENVQY